MNGRGKIYWLVEKNVLSFLLTTKRELVSWALSGNLQCASRTANTLCSKNKNYIYSLAWSDIPLAFPICNYSVEWKLGKVWISNMRISIQVNIFVNISYWAFFFKKKLTNWLYGKWKSRLKCISGSTILYLIEDVC